MEKKLDNELYNIEMEKLKVKIIKIVPDLIEFCKNNFKYYLFYLDVFNFSFGLNNAPLTCYVVSDEDINLDEEITINEVIINVKNITLNKLKEDLYIRTNFLLSVSEGLYDFGNVLNDEFEYKKIIDETVKNFTNTDLKEFAKFNLIKQYDVFKNEEMINEKVRASVSKFFEITEFYQTIQEVMPMLPNNIAFLILLDNMRRKVCTKALYNFLNHIPTFELIKSEVSAEIIELNYFEKIKKIAKETVEIICE